MTERVVAGLVYVTEVILGFLIKRSRVMDRVSVLDAIDGQAHQVREVTDEYLRRMSTLAQHPDSLPSRVAALEKRVADIDTEMQRQLAEMGRQDYD